MTTSPYLASIALFAGNFAIKDYLYCQGQILTIAQNQALYSLLGINYGGDAKVNFALPNLSGAAIAYPTNDGTFPLYHTVGASTVTLTAAQMPAHTHPVSSTAASNIGIPANNAIQASTSTPGATEVFAVGNQGGTAVTAVSIYAPATTSPVPLSVSGTVSGAGPSTTVGAGQPVSVVQPSLVMGYQICSVGYYPQRA